MAFKGSCIDYVLYGIYRGTIRGLGCLIEVLYNLLDDVIAVHVLDAFYDIVHDLGGNVHLQLLSSSGLLCNHTCPEAASGRSPQAEICFLPPESRST